MKAARPRKNLSGNRSTARIGVLSLTFFVLSFVCGMGLNAQEAKADEPLILRGHQGWVTDVSFSPDSRWIASSGTDHTVRLWYVPSGLNKKVFRNHTDEVFTAVFSPDGLHLASSSLDRSVIVRDTETGRHVQTLTFPSYSTAIGFASGGRLAVGTRDGDISIVDVHTGETIRAWKNRLPQYDMTFPVWTLAFSPDNQFLVTAGPIIIWESKTGEQVQAILRPGAVHSMAVSPDSRLLASAHWNGEARIWDIRTGNVMHSMSETIVAAVRGPSGTENIDVAMPLAAVSLSPDGKLAATAGADKRIRLWDMSSGKLVRSFEGHTRSIVGLSFSPDGHYLASAGLDGTIRVWSIPSLLFTSRACAGV